MSCYLTIYVKEEESKPIPLLSYGRSSTVYRYFNDNISIYFCYDKIDYTELTESNINKVIEDLNKDIKEAEKRLESNLESSKICNIKEEFQELSTDRAYIKEYLDDLKETLQEVKFIKFMVINAAYFETKHKFLMNLG